MMLIWKLCELIAWMATGVLVLLITLLPSLVFVWGAIKVLEWLGAI